MNVNLLSTNDKIIRVALKAYLEKIIKGDYRHHPNVKIVEELGVAHGAARIDLAMINGVLHGFEIKSDLDTLIRLPEQIHFFNEVFDHVTLVVGKTHLSDAIKMIPEWWGVMIAKVGANGTDVSFLRIRDERDNPNQNNAAIASFLWRDEALSLLEERGEADGVRSKKRQIVYQKLAGILKSEELKTIVRDSLCSRPY